MVTEAQRRDFDQFAGDDSQQDRAAVRNPGVESACVASP
jgi:hypothetical protein